MDAFKTHEAGAVLLCRISVLKHFPAWLLTSLSAILAGGLLENAANCPSKHAAYRICQLAAKTVSFTCRICSSLLLPGFLYKPHGVYSINTNAYL